MSRPLRLLLIDNFDSFVYNLAQAFGGSGAEVTVVRNDHDLEELRSRAPDAVVISPGPGAPEEAGISTEAVRSFGAGGVPVLGVCLGHQCIATAFGGRVERAPVGPVHGKTSQVSHGNLGVLRDLPDPFTATRYHSLAVVEEPLPAELMVTAHSEDGTIMGIRHRDLPIEGVQFHPESILCESGPRLLENFLAGAPPQPL
jgi:anthranilate synthase/aminodeoxychorismate synthase-like glutamine amidotransferase